MIKLVRLTSEVKPDDLIYVGGRWINPAHVVSIRIINGEGRGFIGIRLSDDTNVDCYANECQELLLRFNLKVEDAYVLEELVTQFNIPANAAPKTTHSWGTEPPKDETG